MSLSPTVCHPTLTRLQLQCNALREWSEVLKLSSAFPLLHTLIASDNPLTVITPSSGHVFPDLEVLSLNSTLLADWSSFEHLAQLSNLRELSMLRVPVVEAVNEERMRRLGIIARMPRLKKLNKSCIHGTERDEAERWLLREFEGHAHPPRMYAEYYTKHGVLDRLVDVDLSPRKTIKLQFHFKDGRDMVTRSVKMNQSIGELRSWVARELLGDPSARVRLVYVDCMGWEGRQVLSLSGRKLHTYRDIADGDQIHVRVLP